MTLTPNLGLPYPELSDTADVPRDIKALASKLDVLLGGGGSGGGGSQVGLNLPVLDVGMLGQIRAGRQLSVADFTSLGLTVPAGLWNLGSLANLGSGGPLVNLGAVPFGPGINGLASTAAVFAGSTGQALYIADTGTADPFRIRSGSWGCWFRTGKRGTPQNLVSKLDSAASSRSWDIELNPSNVCTAVAFVDPATTFATVTGTSDVADDRWHHAVATYDGTMLRLYVDGIMEDAKPLAGPLNPSTGPLNIGAYGGSGATAPSGPHYGRVDEAFVTADVLTADQVRLLYCSTLAHTLGAIPSAVRVAVHRRRRGGAFAAADFPAQPVRLHNFTAGALTDQGSGGVPLTNNGAVSVAGADGAPGGAFSFAGAQSLSSTDAGLPGGLTARSYGCWFKTASAATVGIILAWGTDSTADTTLYVNNGALNSTNAADFIGGPFAADGAWHHAVVVEDNTAGDGVRRRLYLDGRLVGGSTVLNSITLAGAFKVGVNTTGLNAFVGQIDGVFVCAGALTASDVFALYGKGTQDPGASPKNSGDHVERADAAAILFTGDTLQSNWTVDVGVIA